MSEKMRTIVIDEPGKVSIREVDKPVAGPYEVLIKIQSCSLCTVEQRSFLGKKSFGYPFAGGHENSGVVVETGELVNGFKVGDKVVATFQYCGYCEFCRTGRGTQCQNLRKSRKRFNFEGTIVGGAFAQYLAVPQWQVLKLEDSADLDHTALVEPLACVIHSMEKTKIKFGDTVVVIGSGIMGYLHMKLARMSGARVIVSEVDDFRRDKAHKAGANYVVNPAKENAVEFVKQLTNGVGADVVINTIATPKVWDSAIEMLAPYGRLIGYSSQESNDPVGISFGQLHSKEYEFIGTVSPTAESNMRAAKLITYGLINMEEVIDSRYPFEQAELAIKRACEPNTYRVIIKFD